MRLGRAPRDRHPADADRLYWGAFLDNVSVVADGQVPAPATLMLLGLGLLGLGAARRPS